VGGVLIQTLSWHWIFFVNIIVGAFVIPLSFRLLPSPAKGDTSSETLDFIGLALMSTGLVAISYGLAEAGTYATFNDAHVYMPVLVGVVLVAGFVLRALRIEHPLLDLRLYGRMHFSAASIVMFALGAAVFGAMILMPLYWQDIRGFDVIKTGLLTGPQGLGMALTMPLAAKLTDRYGGGPVAFVGVVVTALMTIPFALIGDHTSILALCLAMVARGAGMGASFMPAMTAAFAALERHEITHATPQLNVLNRIGGSIGTTILAVVLVNAERHAHTAAGAAHAFGIAFWWSVALAALAIIPCVVLMRAEAGVRRAAKSAGRQDPDREAIDSGAVAEALV
ncbi:MAG: MFS transporter, partial [Solirubrobacteraceae bacterium]